MALIDGCLLPGDAMPENTCQHRAFFFAVASTLVRGQVNMSRGERAKKKEKKGKGRGKEGMESEEVG